jgi:hypothetical protein
MGPLFFSETITPEFYKELIMNFISILPVNEQDVWFQKDGATAHIKFNNADVKRVLW